MDVGTRLRDARDRLGLTLDAIAASTKVPKQTLDHIDHDRFDRLPGGILTRGHLRAYASAVGLEPEDIVASYLVQYFGEAGEDLPITPPPPVESEAHAGLAWFVELLMIVCAIALYSAYRLFAPSPVAPPALEARPWVILGELVSLDAGNEPGAWLEIRPSGPCGVSATAADDASSSGGS